jgi:hypothetical protein
MRQTTTRMSNRFQPWKVDEIAVRQRKLLALTGLTRESGRKMSSTLANQEEVATSP